MGVFKIPPSTKWSSGVRLYVTQEDYAALQEIAREAGRSLSAHLRSLALKEIRRHRAGQQARMPATAQR
jgi:hypothetical protein